MKTAVGGTARFPDVVARTTEITGSAGTIAEHPSVAFAGCLRTAAPSPRRPPKHGLSRCALARAVARALRADVRNARDVEALVLPRVRCR